MYNFSKMIKTVLGVLYLTILCLWQASPVQAQKPAVIFDRTYGGNFSQILRDGEVLGKNMFLVGLSSSGAPSGDVSGLPFGGSDYWVLKVDSLGNKKWDKRLGGTGDDTAYDVAITTDGNVLVAGRSASGISGNKTTASKGGNDTWVVKMRPDGAILWDKTYGGTGNEQVLSIRTDSDGNFFLLNSSNSGIGGDKTEASRGGFDFWIIKADQNGNIIWEKTLGGNQDDVPREMIILPDGDLIVGGTSRSLAGMDKISSPRGGGLDDFWLLRLDSQGNKIWDKIYGGNGDDQLTGISLTPGGNLLLTGSTYSDAGYDVTDQPIYIDYWLVQADLDGNKQWDKSIGGTNDDRARDILVEPNGNIWLFGNSNSIESPEKSESSIQTDFWLVKLDPAGNILTDKTVQKTGEDDAYRMKFLGSNIALFGTSGSNDEYRLTLLNPANFSVTLTTQAEVDNFNLNQIPQDLTISGADITNLNGLTGLSSVGNKIVIKDNPNLTSINGLSNVQFAPKVIISNNDKLVTLDGIPFNATSQTTIEISDNAILEDISALEGLREVKFLTIKNNDALTTLYGLHTLTGPINTLSIQGNDSLNILADWNIYSLENLQVIDNGNLSDCKKLCQLTKVATAYKNISGNGPGCDLAEVSALCTTCSASTITLRSQAQVNNFDCSSFPGELIISGDDIVSLDSLSTLKGAVDKIRIVDNPNLPSLAGLGNAFADSYYVNNNDRLTSLNGLRIGQYLRTFEIKDNAALKDVSKLSGIRTVIYLNIGNNDALTQIVDLPNLTALTYLLIENNDSLVSFPNLPGGFPITSASIINNPLLTMCGALCTIYPNVVSTLKIENNGPLCNLQELQTIRCTCSNDRTLTTQADVDAFSCPVFNADLRIAGPGITNLNALNILTEVGGRLVIENNTSLSSLLGLSSLQDATTIIIRNNPRIKTINELSSLETVSNTFSLQNNDSLTDIGNLSRLTSTGILNISGNDRLTVLTGFDNFTNVATLILDNNASLSDITNFADAGQFGFVTITNNPSLNDCCFLWNIQARFSGGLTLNNNGPACTNLCGRTAAAGGVQVYPNPVLSSEVNVEYVNSENTKTYYQLFDANGQVLKEGELDGSKGRHTQTIPMQELPEGKYIIQVHKGKEVSTMHLLK